MATDKNNNDIADSIPTSLDVDYSSEISVEKLRLFENDILLWLEIQKLIYKNVEYDTTLNPNEIYLQILEFIFEICDNYESDVAAKILRDTIIYLVTNAKHSKTKKEIMELAREK